MAGVRAGVLSDDYFKRRLTMAKLADNNSQNGRRAGISVGRVSKALVWHKLDTN